MGQRSVLVVVFGLAMLAGAWWWTHRGHGADKEISSPSPTTATSASPSTSQHAAAPVSAEPERAHLAVHVTDAHGPVAAVVRLSDEHGEVTVVRAGADGLAHADVAAGRWSISASAEGHEPRAADKPLAAGETATIELVLAGGGRPLSGLVSDSTGGPIAGARVDAAKLTGVDPADAVASTTTGADGRYKLTVQEGQLLVAVSDADYAPQSRYVDIGPAGATASFSLVPGGVIEGIVRDEASKEPVAGARVEAARDTETITLAESTTHTAIAGADGKFRLTGLAPGAWELGGKAPGKWSRTPAHVGLGVAEQVTDVAILIGAGPRVRGKVVDDHDAPVAGVSVVAIDDSGQDVHTTADAHGAFVLDGLHPGRWMLEGTHKDYTSGERTDVALANKDVDGVVVHVEHGLAITGHVDARQVCDVRFDSMTQDLTFARAAAPMTTAADGEFELGPFAPGKGTLVAHCPGGDEGTLALDIAAGMPAQIVRVAPGASIAGRVVDGDGKPVANVTVMSVAMDSQTERTTIVNGVVTSGAKSLTTAAGAYEVRGLAPGLYRLTVLDGGRALHRKKGVKLQLAAGEHKTGADIVVARPTGTISGTVTGPDGAPLPDAWVAVHQDSDALMASMASDAADDEPKPAQGERHSMTVEMMGGPGGASEFPPALTDGKGHFEIGSLPHSTYEVVAEAQAGKLRGRAVDVKPDATLAIQVVGVSTLTGTVTGPHGLAAEFDVELVGPSADTRGFTDGAFEFARIDPGAYVVHVTSPDGNADTKVTVVPGQPATLDVTLLPNAVVIGKLVDAAGNPMAGVGVVIVDDQPEGQVGVRINGAPPESGPDGTFRVEGKAGTRTLVALIRPVPFAKRGLVLEAGKTIDVGTINLEATPPPKPAR